MQHNKYERGDNLVCKKARHKSLKGNKTVLTSYPSNGQLSQQPQQEMVAHGMKTADYLKLFGVD